MVVAIIMTENTSRTSHDSGQIQQKIISHLLPFSGKEKRKEYKQAALALSSHSSTGCQRGRTCQSSWKCSESCCIHSEANEAKLHSSWNIFQSVNGIIPFSVKTYKAKLGYKMDLLQSVIGVIIFSVKINKAKLGNKYGSPAISHPLLCQVPQDQWGSHIMELAPHQETLNSPCHGLAVIKEERVIALTWSTTQQTITIESWRHLLYGIR